MHKVNLRIKKLKSLFRKNKLDAYLITNDVNIKYLLQFSASESWLLVTSKKSYYITDARYTLEAKKGIKDAEVIQYDKSIVMTLFDLVRRFNLKFLGFDERHLSYARFKFLKKSSPRNVDLIGCNSLVERLRETKSRNELAQIKKALDVHSLALKHIKKYIKPGSSERIVLDQLESFTKKHQVGFSFDPIISIGF